MLIFHLSTFHVLFVVLLSFGVHGEPPLLYAVVLCLDFADAPERGEGYYAHENACHVVCAKKAACCKQAAGQYKQQETLWQKQSHRLTDIVRNNEGVWLSAKIFYIVGSLSLLSIITIVLEIAFYVYFHWIQ